MLKNKSFNLFIFLLGISFRFSLILISGFVGKFLIAIHLVCIDWLACQTIFTTRGKLKNYGKKKSYDKAVWKVLDWVTKKYCPADLKVFPSWLKSVSQDGWTVLLRLTQKFWPPWLKSINEVGWKVLAKLNEKYCWKVWARLTEKFSPNLQRIHFVCAVLMLKVCFVNLPINFIESCKQTDWGYLTKYTGEGDNLAKFVMSSSRSMDVCFAGLGKPMKMSNFGLWQNLGGQRGVQTNKRTWQWGPT